MITQQFMQGCIDELNPLFKQRGVGELQFEHLKNDPYGRKYRIWFYKYMNGKDDRMGVDPRRQKFLTLKEAKAYLHGLLQLIK